MDKLLYKEISYKIQGAFFAVYRELGNGFKENVYHNALIEELENGNIFVETNKRLDVYYRGKRVGIYVPDLIVEDKIIVEIKCKPRLIKQDLQQFWQYLRGSNYKVGYLVNFGSFGKVEYIRRVYDTARSGV